MEYEARHQILSLGSLGKCARREISRLSSRLASTGERNPQIVTGRHDLRTSYIFVPTTLKPTNTDQNTSSSPDGPVHVGMNCDILRPGCAANRYGTLAQGQERGLRDSNRERQVETVMLAGADQLKAAARVTSLRAQPYQWLCLHA